MFVVPGWVKWSDISHQSITDNIFTHAHTHICRCACLINIWSNIKRSQHRFSLRKFHSTILDYFIIITEFIQWQKKKDFSFSTTASVLWWYHLFTLSNGNHLNNFYYIFVTTLACLFLYSFWVNFLHLLTMVRFLCLMPYQP